MQPSTDCRTERLSPCNTWVDIPAGITEDLRLGDHVKAKDKVDNHGELKDRVSPSCEFGCVHRRCAIKLEEK